VKWIQRKREVLLSSIAKNCQRGSGGVVKGKVYFVGAGPGDPDMLTVKGRRLLEEAELVIYYGFAVSQKIVDCARGTRLDSYGLSLEEIMEAMLRTVEAGGNVVRLHSGDPSLFGGMLEQIDALKRAGVEIEIVPGVSSLFASAALLETQLTLPGVAQTLIITRPNGDESIKELSKHRSTMAIFLGVSEIREIMETVEYPKDMPVAVIYHACWDDEQIFYGTVGDIADTVESAGIKEGAMILIGEVVQPKTIMRLTRGES